jgi:hypothetical protein
VTIPRSLTFRRWLRNQRHRHDAIGALAQDIVRDVHNGCLRDQGTYAQIKGHMRRRHEASTRMLHALDQAYQEWAVGGGGQTHDRG